MKQVSNEIDKPAITTKWLNDLSQVSQTQLAQEVSEFIYDEYGISHPYHRHLIGMLVEQIELYKKCTKHIEENGIVLSYNKGMTQGKNPFLGVRNQTAASIIQCLRELGMTPKSRLPKKPPPIAPNSSLAAFLQGVKG